MYLLKSGTARLICEQLESRKDCQYMHQTYVPELFMFSTMCTIILNNVPWYDHRKFL